MIALANAKMNQLAAVSSLLVLAGTAMAGSKGMDHLPYRGEGHVMVNEKAFEWKPVASMAKGARMTVLEGDLSKGEAFTFRLKLPANYKIAPHIHPAYERVTVLSGTFHFAHGEEFDRGKTMALKQGGFAVMAPGEPMYGYTEEATVIQLHGTGPWGIQYLNPADDPRK